MTCKYLTCEQTLRAYSPSQDIRIKIDKGLTAKTKKRLAKISKLPKSLCNWSGGWDTRSVVEVRGKICGGACFKSQKSEGCHNSVVEVSLSLYDKLFPQGPTTNDYNTTILIVTTITNKFDSTVLLEHFKQFHNCSYWCIGYQCYFDFFIF